MHYLGNTLSLNYPVIAQSHMNRTEREVGGSGIARGVLGEEDKEILVCRMAAGGKCRCV